MSSSVSIKRVSGKALRAYISDVARLRIAVFRDFPYLYDGTTEYEEKYLQTYIDCDEAVVVLALDGEQVVGASTAIPMQFETAEFQAPLLQAGLNPEKIFYCAESVLLAPYRGLGLGWRFFDEREAHARELGRFSHSCFCAVERAIDHPLRPHDHQSLDSLWNKRGYYPQNLTTLYRWKDIDQTHESDKTMRYWLKNMDEQHG